MSLAKGLSGAYQPISAVMVSQPIYDAMRDQSRKLGFFAHAFTTTGHPVAVAVALRCQELIEERDIIGHVGRVAPLLQQGLRDFADHPLVGNVRGVGMMGAVELVADKATRRSFDQALNVKQFMVDRAREHGLIIRSALAGDSLAFAPPLIITEAEIETMLERFAQALDDTTRWVEENGLTAHGAA
jgi:4-aminobutyrate--pyruvate transaminase